MPPRSRDQNTVQDRHPTTGHTTGEAGKSEVEANNSMQAGRVIAHPHEQDNKHELEEMREGRGLLQRRLRTAFDDPTWSDLAFRCQWPPHDASTRAELLQGSGEEPSSPPSPPSPSSSPTRGPAAPELEVYVHRVVVAAWSDALAQLCRLQSNNKEEGEIRGGGGGGDGDTTTQDGQQLKLLDVFEKEEEGEPTQRGRRRTVVELQATEPGDPSALRLLLAFLYSGDLAQALDDTAACRFDGSGARSDADHGAVVRPHIFLKSILQDAAGGDDISPADRHTAKMVVARAANLGLGYGVPELHQQFKSSSMWIADTESSPTTPPYHVSADDGLVESPLDALLAAASQHPLVRAGAIPAAESPVTTAEVKLGGFQEGRSLRGSTERRVPARYCSPDVEVYKGTWEVRGKRKPAPAPTSPSPASPTSFSPHTSPPTIGRRSARLMEQELTVAETTADVMAATKEAREAADDDSEQDPDSGSSALDAPGMHSVARRSSRRHSGGLERKPSETRKKRRKEEVEEVDEEEEEDDDEYDQRHESMRIIANANKKRRAVAKAKQTRESAAAVPPPEDNADEETFALVETNDHPTVDTTIVPSAKSLPAAVLLPRSATELASPRGVRDVAFVTDQPVITETQVLAAAAASGQIRRSLKQLRKEHGKNCHNCKTRKIDFVTCLVRPTHRFCDGCLRKLFNVEFANAHAEWDGIVHPEGCAICRHMCPCVGCRKRAHPPASPARNSSDASRKAKRPRDDADATDQHAPQRASGSGHCAAGSGDNDDSPRTKKPTESEKAEKNEKREEKKKVKEEKKTSSSSKRRRTRSLIDGRESTQEKESEDRVRRSSLDMHEDEDSVEMMTDADANEHLAAIPPGKSTRSRSKRAAATSTPPHSKSTRSSARRSGGGGRSAAKGFNVPEGAGPEAFLGLVSAGSALSQRPTRRTPIRAPSADD